MSVPFVRSFLHAALLAVMALTPLQASAATPAVPPAAVSASPEMAALAELESRASAAKVADQCAMLAQLAQGLTELAGHQLADGHAEEATATIQRLDALTARIRTALNANPNHLQEAEQALHASARHFTDIVRVTSDNTARDLHTTMKHLDAIHAEVLNQLFKH